MLFRSNRDCKDFDDGTIRQHKGDLSLCKPKFYASAFYYLSFLLEKNPKEIYDLGCGWNIFKKYIPNIIGVGAENPSGPWFHADIHDYVDDDYVKGHQSTFESVFSICALHFIPLRNIRKRVLDFGSMIKPGGRGWVSFNAQRMVERDFEFIAKYTNNHKSLEGAVDQYVRTELAELPFNVLVFDVYLEKIENGMNGNIHIVIEKLQD